MTHYYRERTPCETCGPSDCGEEHVMAVTEYNTSCTTKIRKTIGEHEAGELNLTWAEADALARLLAEAGHAAKGAGK